MIKMRGSVVRGTSSLGRVGLLIAMLWAAATQAEVCGGLIATDHFLAAEPGDPAAGEYDVTAFRNQLRRGEANGGGQNPTTFGFVDPWSGNVTSGTLGVAQWTAQLEPLGSDLPYQRGGRARFAGVDNLQRRVQRALAPYEPSDVYYMSFVSQVLTDELDLDGFAGIGFTNTGASVAETDAQLIGGDGLRGVLIGVAGDGVAGTDYVLRHVGSTGQLQDEVLLDNIVQNDEEGSPFVRYTLIKLELNDDPGNPQGNSRLTVWQDPPTLSSEAAASAAAPPQVFRTFALESAADLTHLTFTGIDYSRAASFDEPRLASDWASATGGYADANGDGFTDGVDFLTWQRNFGVESGAELAQGDVNGDGAVDRRDEQLWKWRWGGVWGQSGAAALAIPEPAAAALLATAAALVGVRRRRM